MKIGWVLGDYPTDLHQTWPPRLEDEEKLQQHFIMVGAARCTGGHKYAVQIFLLRKKIIYQVECTRPYFTTFAIIIHSDCISQAGWQAIRVIV